MTSGLLQRFKDNLRDVVRAPELPSLADLPRDITAGVAVGVMVVPMGMAYAVLAGLPPIYGLYASFVPLLVYPLLGSAKRVAVGIVAIDMLIVGAAAGRLGADSVGEVVTVALTLSLLAGLLHLTMGLLRLGWVVAYLSRPVVTGFLLAAPILIGVGQLGNLLGIPWPRTTDLLLLFNEDLGGLGSMHPETLILGLGSLVLLVVLGRVSPGFPWVLVVLGAASLLTLRLGLSDVALTGAVPPGLPKPGLPGAGLYELRSLIGSALTLMVIQHMTVVTLARRFAPFGEETEVDPNRELVAMGASNMLGSLFGAPPISASMSRSSVASRMGVRTAWSNAVAALVVVLALTVASDLLALVPMPALAAVIIFGALGMISFNEIRLLFVLHRGEGLLAAVTFLLVLLLGVQEGVLLGVGTSVVIMLVRIGRPPVVELGRMPETGDFRSLRNNPMSEQVPGDLVLRIDGSLSLAGGDHVRRKVIEALDDSERPIDTIVLDGRGVNFIDTTGLRAMQMLLDEVEGRGIELHFSNFKRGARAILLKAGLLERRDLREAAAPVERVVAELDGERVDDAYDP